jgi:hypothetical protein
MRPGYHPFARLPERDADPNTRLENVDGVIFSVVLTKTGAAANY